MAIDRSKSRLQPPPGAHQEQELFVAYLRIFVRQVYEILEVGGGLDDIVAGAESRAALGAVAPLTQAISDPPGQAEVQAIQDKVNALLAAAKG